MGELIDKFHSICVQHCYPFSLQIIYITMGFPFGATEFGFILWCEQWKVKSGAVGEFGLKNCRSWLDINRWTKVEWKGSGDDG